MPTQTVEPDVRVKGLAVKRVIRFEEFELSDPPSHLLKNGAEVHLRPQVMRALLRLAGSPGEVVTRDALREVIWKDLQHVEVDRGIKTVIRELRKALGDDPSDPRFIETVRGVGYRFVARGQLQEEPLVRAAPRPRRRSLRVWITAVAILAVVALIAVGSIVLTPDQPTLVLPRLRTSESASHLAPMCERLNDELVRELITSHSGKLSLIHVFAPPEELSMSPRVARFAVDGHLAPGESEGDIYIALELIDRANGTIVWVGTYDLSESDVAAWPAESASQLADAVLEATS